jgi:hypothetical protein
MQQKNCRAVTFSLLSVGLVWFQQGYSPVCFKEIDKITKKEEM